MLNRFIFGGITGALIAGGARYLYLDKSKDETLAETQLKSSFRESPGYESVRHWNQNWNG